MKKIGILFLALLMVSCHRSTGWEGVKTAGRHFNRGIDHLTGKTYDTCMINSDDEFSGPVDGEYIPLNDHDLCAMGDTAIGQPNGSLNLGLFKAPDDKLQSLFQTIHFNTDDHIIHSQSDLIAVQKIGNYLKKHTNLYITIEGHCDERASAAYNLALGTRRANHIRVLLIKQGVDFNRIYTVSHGKEKPIAIGHTEADWRQNRRSEFKLYEKS